jgi:hypothetical protein
MSANRRLALHASLPDRYASYEVIASSIDHLGRLVALVTAPGSSSGLVAYISGIRPLPRYQAVAIICAGNEVHEIPLVDLDLWFNEIDTLGDGVVLASRRCEAPGVDVERYLEPIPSGELHLTESLRVFDTYGQPQAAFYVGDGIEQLMTDPSGHIWTSYFDESNYWFPNPDGTRSYGFGIGLARWGGDGSGSWIVSCETPEVFWCDCYAVNVGQHKVYAYPYPDFQLIELEQSRVSAVIPNSSITRCHGLAVDGNELAFLDQLRKGNGFRWAVRHARLEGQAIVETGRERLVLPDGRQPAGWARGKIGRGHSLWLRVDGDPGNWYRYEIDSP